MPLNADNEAESRRRRGCRCPRGDGPDPVPDIHTIFTQRVQLVVRQSRQQPAPHLACAGVVYTGMPADAIIPQTFRQHGHVEGRVVSHQQTAVHQWLQFVPQFRKRGSARRHLRRDPGQFDVEPVEMRLRVDQRVKFFCNFSVLDHRDTDGAHTVVGAVRCFYVKSDVSVSHSLPPPQ